MLGSGLACANCFSIFMDCAVFVIVVVLWVILEWLVFYYWGKNLYFITKKKYFENLGNKT